MFESQTLWAFSHSVGTHESWETHEHICFECRFSPSYGIFTEYIFSGTKYSTGPITSWLIKGRFIKTIWYNSSFWLRAWIKFYKFFTAVGIDMHIMLLVRAFMKCCMVALKLIFDGQWFVWSRCFWLFSWAGCFLGKCFFLWLNKYLSSWQTMLSQRPLDSIHVASSNRQEYATGLCARGCVCGEWHCESKV